MSRNKTKRYKRMFPRCCGMPVRVDQSISKKDKGVKLICRVCDKEFKP